MLNVDETFELEDGFPSIKTKTEDTGLNVNGSSFLPGASLATCIRQIWDAKTMPRCHGALESVQDEAPYVFASKATRPKDTFNF